MCLVAYLASDQPLDPPADDSDGLVLTIEPLAGRHRGQPAMGKRYVYVLSSGGCACALIEDGPEDTETLRLKEELQTYLGRAVAGSGPVELLACWTGAEAEAAVAVSLTVADVATIDFDAAADQPFRALIR